MNSRNEQLFQRLLAMFTVEAEEHVGSLAVSLRELEQGVSEQRARELIEKTFREVHTLKGAARTVNLTHLVALCHAMESLLALLKRGDLRLAPAVVAVLSDGFAALRQMVPNEVNGTSPPPVDRLDMLVQRLEGAARLGSSPPPLPPPPTAPPVALAPTPPPPPVQPPPPPPKPARDEGARPAARQTLRVPIERLDFLLHQAEELITAKLSGGERVAEIRALGHGLTERMRTRQRLDAAQQADHDAQTLAWIGAKLGRLALEADQDVRGLSKGVDSLLSGTKQVLMLPAATLLEPVAQDLRDLSRRQGKDVHLVLAGQELELDRRVQEELREALLHLARNAIDHGIELPADRLAAGKPAHATVTLSVSQREGGRAEIAIADDGKGMDLGRLASEAVAQGLLEAEQAAGLASDQVMALAFQSGLSTSNAITDISGRGLGLAIVQEKVERLGGTVTVESLPGRGTTFRLLLPVTMAAFRVVMADVCGGCYAMPTNRIERVGRVASGEVMTVEGREMLRIDGRPLALVRLCDLLRLGAAGPAGDFRSYIVLAAAGQRLAVEVEHVVGESEILMKPLGWPLTRVPAVAGAVALPSGRLGFVLNVHEVLRAALRPDFQAMAARPVTNATANARKSILIAEDSITARTLFKHVLEAAGFRVRTCVDGMEAWNVLAGELFDLVVSDVEMPRMGGFELTERIRQEPRLSDIPVILITSLETREDRERGVDVGASAYIVKRSFDQSDLLDIIGRLI
ncbi:response regulator [Niveispirillum sp.]|uniref:hybrid sensor histidine kinase/response regulator n=1 Tax=Niveispirillum sp. TaxID=1917217 RepID=UPI001B53320F|nr:response regulator [Niveispirillum sp.]MBP7334460.1 response regulator [Niveispirillum sp.]